MNVKVYGTPTCPHCHMAQDFLKENNVDFEYLDISVDQDAAKEMVEKSGQMALPVIDIDGEIIIGFDKEKMKEKLNLD